jgi:conjugative transposon TraM protein
MRGIRIKQPKYIVPLLLIPFNAFLFYMFGDSIGNPVSEQTEPQANVQELQTDLPSPNLDRLPLKNKFESFQENFKYKRDFSAIKEIDLRETKNLSEKDQILVDSVNDALISGEKKSFMTQVNERTKSYAPVKSYHQEPSRQESEYEIQMRLFKEQMRYIDSLNRVSAIAENDTKREIKEADSVKTTLVHVTKKPERNSSHFNTVKPFDENHFIQAIIDENVKVVPGSRVRIRLLDDIYAGDQLIRKGNYLFGTVTSFKPQRIEISITSILIDDQITNVDLKVYDNDGLPGVYVPASQFRDFTKDLASNTVSGQNLQFAGTPENQTEMLYSMAERAYSTATRSIGKAAKKNKGKLKYNTILYLVNANINN